MADERLEVLLKARIDPTSQKDLQVQATAVGEKLEPIDLGIRIDTKKAIQSFSELKKVMKEVTSLAKQNEDGILGDAVDIQTIEKFKNAFGKTVTIIDSLIQKTNEFGNQTTEVSTEITKSNTNLEKQNQLIDKASKLQNELNLARQKFDIVGQADLYKLDNNLNVEAVEKLRDRFKSINVAEDGSNLDEVLNNIKSINKEYDLIINDANLNKKINDDIVKQNADIVKQKEKELKLHQEIKAILDKLPSSAVGTNDTQDLYSLLDSTTEIKDLQALKDITKQYYNESIASEKELTNTQKLKIQGIKEAYNDYKRMQDISTKVDKGLADLNSVKTSYSGANVQDFERLENAWKDIRTQIQNGTIDYEEANNAIKKLINSNKDFETSAKKASIATNSLGDRLKKAFQYFTFYDVLQMGKRAVENMVEVIFDLDDALVDLRKVSDLSGQSLQDFTRQAYNLGTEISKSGSEVIRASTAFAKAGFADSELLNLAKSALVLTSIGDDLTDASESAETLISVMKGFGKSTSEIPKIMDAINNVSNNASVSFSDVTMALQRMSGVMNASNITMEKSVGMFVAINEVLRNTEMTSTSLNSISMRMRGLSEDGEAIDGLVPKLQKMYKTIAGIDMTDSNGQLKNMYDIVGELAPKWDTLTENQKQFIASESAGLRQSKSFLIMMDNYDRVLEATALAYDSTGSAQQEFIKWQDSLEGRMNNLKSAIEQFASETINSSFVKSIISATTELVKFGTAVGGAVPIIISLGTAFLAFQKGSIVSTLFISLITQIKILTTTTIGAVGAVTALQMALGVGFVVAGILGVSYAINSISERANKAKEAVNNLSSELKDLQDKTVDINKLTNRFFELKGIDKTNEQLQEYYGIQNQLKELIPDLNGHIDEQGNFIISEEENVRSLSDAYKILIDDKRQALALASKESAKYTLDDYNKQKDRIDILNQYGQQYLELAQKAEQGKLDTTDLDQVNFLQSILGIPLNVADIKKAFSEAQSAIKQSLSDMQTNIRNQLVGSDEWETIGKDLSDSILKELSNLSEKEIGNLSKKLNEGTIFITDIINGLKLLAEESKKTTPALTNQATEFLKLQEAYKNGDINLTKYTEELRKLNAVSNTYRNEIQELGVVQEYLGGVIEKVTKGESLSKDEISELVSLYPELESAIYKTVDGYSLESETLNILNDDVVDLKTAYADAQTSMNLMSEQGTLKRIGLTLKEIDALQTQAELLNQINNNGKKVIGKPAPYASDYRNNNLVEQGLDLVTGDAILYDDLIPIIDYKEAQKKIEDIISRIGEGLNPSALGDSIKSSADKAISEVDKFKEELERLKNEIDKILSDNEFEISLLGFSGGEDTLTKQIAIYQQMQEKVHELAQKYRAMGLSENDDYIQQLRTQWMDYAENISQLQSVAFDNSNKSIDRTITQLDLQQQLFKDNSQEYLDIEQKKYDEIVKRENLLQQEIARLQAIGTNSAKEQAESLIDTYYDTVSQRYNIIKNLQSSQISIYNEQIKELENQKSALEDIHKYTMQMIKDELNAKKKSVQEEIKGIEEVFNKRKQALRDEKDARSYEKGLTEKSSVVADLENQLALIKNDETAIAKRKQLEQELAKAKEDLADYQYDHSIELSEKALDTELEIQKSKLEEEISELDDTLSNEVTMRELANKRIEKSGEKLKNQLIAHAKEYGTFTIEEVTNAWEIAGEAVDDFNLKQLDLLDTLGLVADKLKEVQADLKRVENQSVSDYGSSIGANTSYKKSDAEKHAQMVANSKAWTSASSDKKLDLESENQKLGKELGYEYNPSEGVWYRYVNGKKIRAYHKGGVVGGLGYATKSTEELAKLLKGELVVTPPQADKVMDMITNNSNSNITISMPIVVEGNANSDTVKALEKQVGKIADTVIDKLNQARANTGFKKKPKFV